MDKPKPLKRAKSIQPLSRDHHHTLLFCWKIRKGFSKAVAPERMKKYADWFYHSHVSPHFKMEEDYLFPILGNDHDMVKRALSEHRRLERLFHEPTDIEKALSLLEEELESHVRFEERVLFNEIQGKATPEELEVISEKHADEKFQENSTDEFWL